MFGKKKNSIPHDPVAGELERIRSLPFAFSGVAQVFEKPFKFHHAASFTNTYRELFEEEMYKFNPKIKEGGVILDCGANMGLSVLYFAKNYPNHRIIAFEPEKAVFDILKENVETFGLSNVELHQKAVWKEATTLSFQSDGGMGGRVKDLYQESDQAVSKVETTPLTDWLSDKTDFLKMDIEGAEFEVLQSCKGEIGKVRHIFFEYHNDIHKPQSLHVMLKTMVDLGFKYHIKESSSRKRPFIDKGLICERFDMAITVFCYKTDG